MIKIVEYLSAFPGVKSSGKFGEMYLNKILFKNIPNEWNKQIYVHSFDCEYVPF